MKNHARLKSCIFAYCADNGDLALDIVGIELSSINAPLPIFIQELNIFFSATPI